jgi:hypothetical protein
MEDTGAEPVLTTKNKNMKTVYFICSLLMIGMISCLFREYPMLVGCFGFGIGIGYMREKNRH